MAKILYTLHLFHISVTYLLRVRLQGSLAGWPVVSSRGEEGEGHPRPAQHLLHLLGQVVHVPANNARISDNFYKTIYMTASWQYHLPHDRLMTVSLTTWPPHDSVTYHMNASWQCHLPHDFLMTVSLTTWPPNDSVTYHITASWQCPSLLMCCILLSVCSLANSFRLLQLDSRSCIYPPPFSLQVQWYIHTLFYMAPEYHIWYSIPDFKKCT